MIVFDFAMDGGPWRSIDDVVMGGRSSSAMVIDAGRAIFSGTVSTEDGGGFASVRSMADRFDLSGFGALLVRLKGDGRIYGLRLKTSERFDDLNYQARVGTESGIWREHRIPFGEFAPVYRGRPVTGAHALDPAAIRSFGWMVSGGQKGPFRLEIAWIKADA